MNYSLHRFFVKSRENLQAIFKNPDEIRKYNVFDVILSAVWHNIILSLQQSPKSLKYIINLRDPNYLRRSSYEFVFTEEIILELIEILKKEYPGVDFTYKETAGYDGKIIEQIIIMDWS